jgi:hypothetical protein
MQLPDKLGAAVRRVTATNEPVSINELATVIRETRQQFERDLQGNIGLLRRKFGDDMIDQALIEARKRLTR